MHPPNQRSVTEYLCCNFVGRRVMTGLLRDGGVGVKLRHACITYLHTHTDTHTYTHAHMRTRSSSAVQHSGEALNDRLVPGPHESLTSPVLPEPGSSLPPHYLWCWDSEPAGSSCATLPPASSSSSFSPGCGSGPAPRQRLSHGPLQNLSIRGDGGELFFSSLYEAPLWENSWDTKNQRKKKSALHAV